MLAYRPDVDGLRAVAVLSVVAYHAIPSALPGGFVGVDVFFVISGYLITRLIAADLDRGRFSIASFYVRRTKRIFPALFVVLFSTLAAGLYLLTPIELSDLARTMAATATFVSNVAFWQDTGYFDGRAELKPLLHTWSLAIEEQFYVLWPLALSVVYRLRRAKAIVWTFITLSFAFASYMTVRHQPTAFYMLPARAWELLLGAALALRFTPVPTNSRWRNAAGVAGLVLIVLAAFLLNRNSPFPGWNALAPCLGAALLIAAGETGDHAVSRLLLARRPFVFVGLISYSLYLWHWPLFALARTVGRGDVTTQQVVILVGVAFGLSVLTWRYVETPLRATHVTPRAAPVLARYALVSAAALGVALFVQSSRGFLDAASRPVIAAEAARYSVNPRSSSCLRWQSVRGPLPQQPCITDGNRFSRRLVLWGDSHADAVAPAFAALASDHGYASHQLTMAACPPLITAEVRGPGADYRPCSTFNADVLAYVTTNPAVEVVALSARWPLYTEGSRFGDDPGPITYLVDGADQQWSATTSRRVFTRALQATVAAIRRANRSVIVLGTIPALGVNVPSCLARNHMPFSGVRSCDGDAAEVLPRLEFADHEISRFDGDGGVCTFLPKDAFCSDGQCVSTQGTDILYANDDHLSVRGAGFLRRHFSFDQCLRVPTNGLAMR